MPKFKLNTHISARFNIELENLRNSVLTMGGAIEQQLSDTLIAMRDNNRGLAEKVVFNDLNVNSMEMQIDEECLRIIAKRHPAASDLRMVLTVAKTTTDIERIGDEIERIARMIAKGKLPDSADIIKNMLSIGNHVMEMLRGTLNAFARLDSQAALLMYREDEKIDAEYKNLLSDTVAEMQRNSEKLEDWLEVLWAVRALERVGDRCKNICEYVFYLTQGKDMRHSPMESLQEKLEDLR